ncbi:MAG: epimerase [Gammaproteobacteria bacterium]|nr:epimerase [Gammaproteobacteria bacterium]
MMPGTDNGTGDKSTGQAICTAKAAHRVKPKDGRNDKSFAVILGATSLVGRFLAQRLAACGFEGLCLSRHTGPAPYEAPPGFSWNTLPEGKKLGIPASATLFSLTPATALPALINRIAGGNRLIALSSSSVLFKAQSSSPGERDQAQAQARAEERVRTLCRDRGTAWTIFRPTLIYDPGRDRNVSRIASFVQRFGFFPVVWPGTGLCQPIHADDVAQAMAAASGAAPARDATFDLPGDETLTYVEMVRRIFASLGKRPVLVYLPLSLARAAFFLWQSLTGENYSSAILERMNLALTLDPAPVREHLGSTSRPFRPGFPDLK